MSLETREMRVAIFPKIQSPCPYKSQLAAVMDGDMCRMCKRQVFDLTDMDDDGRVAFMAGCTDEVCVSYRIPFRPAIAAAVMAVSTMAPMAAAAEEPTFDIVVGGIRNPGQAEFVQVPADRKLPALPVVYEDADKAAPPAAARPAAAAKPEQPRAVTEAPAQP